MIKNITLTGEDFLEKRFIRTAKNDGVLRRRSVREATSNTIVNTPFLQETNRLKAGQWCNFFEITQFSLEKGKVELDAEISFVKTCDDIKLQAALYNMNQPKTPIKKFEVKDKKNASNMGYHVSSQLASDIKEGEIGVAVYAEWSNEEEPDGSAMILEGAGYDEVKYHHVHPVKCKPYQTFSQKKTNGYIFPEALEQDDGVREEKQEIVIALYRKPEDTSDLNYLCEYGWDSKRRPYLMVPGQGTVSFVNAKIEPSSVHVVCYLNNLSHTKGSGVIVAAVNASKTQVPEYENHDIQVEAHETSIAYSMFHVWDKPFQEGNGLIEHKFSYNILITYKRKGEKQIHALYISNKPVEKNYIYQIPNIIIKWGCLLGDTLICMADGSQKELRDIHIGEKVAGADGVENLVENVWSGQEECYYILKTQSGRKVRASYSHPFLTETGWKTAADLKIGDNMKVRGMFVPEGESKEKIEFPQEESGWEKLASIEKREEQVMVYNLTLNGKPMIANGFVCGDFEMQNGM